MTTGAVVGAAAVRVAQCGRFEFGGAASAVAAATSATAAAPAAAAATAATAAGCGSDRRVRIAVARRGLSVAVQTVGGSMVDDEGTRPAASTCNTRKEKMLAFSNRSSF